MARAAIGWGVRDLASAAKASTDTISRLERGEELKERTLDAIQRALEAAGVEFLPKGGVRLRAFTPDQADQIAEIGLRLKLLQTEHRTAMAGGNNDRATQLQAEIAALMTEREHGAR